MTIICLRITLRTKVHENKIKSDIANGQLFGVVEVDISVKEEFKEFFSEFPPFLHLSSVNVRHR